MQMYKTFLSKINVPPFFQIYLFWKRKNLMSLIKTYCLIQNMFSVLEIYNAQKMSNQKINIRICTTDKKATIKSEMLMPDYFFTS